jgi:hypothetical protein
LRAGHAGRHCTANGQQFGDLQALCAAFRGRLALEVALVLQGFRTWLD